MVAFELPKLGGLRKQSFHVIDRTLARAAAPATQMPAAVPKRLAGKVARLLDEAGAVRALASSRTRLLFEAAPVLFFAEIPTARLKARAAAKLRRAMVSYGVQACVVHAGPAATTLMLWPDGETGIADFVAAAAPEHPLHAEFAAGPQPPARAARPRDVAAAPAAPDRAREARLLQQIAVLQGQVDALTRAQSAVGAMEQLGLDDAKLKSMLKLLHPDKHANSEAATEAAKWLNSMRDLLRGHATA